MQEAALLILVACSLYLIGVGMMMGLQPQRFLRLLRRTAASHQINLTEQGLRLVGGAALIVRSASSKLPGLFETAGWFVVASSVLLMVLPLRFHARYAIWWSHRLTPPILRAIAPLSAAAGAGLLYLAF